MRVQLATALDGAMTTGAAQDGPAVQLVVPFAVPGDVLIAKHGCTGVMRAAAEVQLTQQVVGDQLVDAIRVRDIPYLRPVLRGANLSECTVRWTLYREFDPADLPADFDLRYPPAQTVGRCDSPDAIAIVDRNWVRDPSCARAHTIRYPRFSDDDDADAWIPVEPGTLTVVARVRCAGAEVMYAPATLTLLAGAFGLAVLGVHADQSYPRERIAALCGVVGPAESVQYVRFYHPLDSDWQPGTSVQDYSSVVWGQSGVGVQGHMRVWEGRQLYMAYDGEQVEWDVSWMDGGDPYTLFCIGQGYDGVNWTPISSDTLYAPSEEEREAYGVRQSQNLMAWPRKQQFPHPDGGVAVGRYVDTHWFDAPYTTPGLSGDGTAFVRLRFRARSADTGEVLGTVYVDLLTRAV